MDSNSLSDHHPQTNRDWSTVRASFLMADHQPTMCPQRYNSRLVPSEKAGCQCPMPTQIKHVRRPHVQRITEQVLLAGGQLLVAGGAAIIWEYVANALGWGESWQYPLAPVAPQILDACVVTILGFLLAWSVVQLLPGAAAAGRWVWLPPTVLLALLIGRDLGNGWDWHLISAHYFWNYPAQKLGPIERDTLTYPTLSAITYSLGVQLRTLQNRRGGEG